MCSTVAPSATVPSPKSQRYETASPEAVRTTSRGAAPDLTVAEAATVGGTAPAAAGLKVRTIATTIAARTITV
jgi:hypothetical protein